MQQARIRLSSTQLPALKAVCEQIESVCKNQGIRKLGPIPLPTKKLKVPVMKAPSGLEITANERSMHLIMKIQIPETVLVEIELM